MAKTKKRSVKTVWVLGWDGMEKRRHTMYNIPKDKVEISDWFHAKKEGELCINNKGEIDQLKKIVMVGGDGMFKRCPNYYFVHDNEVATDAYLVGVKRGQVFRRWNKRFTYSKHSLRSIIDARKD